MKALVGFPCKFFFFLADMFLQMSARSTWKDLGLMMTTTRCGKLFRSLARYVEKLVRG